MANDDIRQEYMRRLGLALGKPGCDWSLVNYCLMSSHTHKCLESGHADLDRWMRPLNSGFAGWLNRVRRRVDGKTRGPVFAQRPTAIIVPRGSAPRLGYYAHNNTVRAGVCKSPEQSTWSSHQAYLGLVEAPPFLDVKRGLAYAGLPDTKEGRLAYHDATVARVSDPRDPLLSGSRAGDARATVRKQIGTAAELSTPRLVDGGLKFGMVTAPAAKLASFDGAAVEVIAYVARLLRLQIALLLSRSRVREVSLARRVALVAWGQLGRRQHEMASALGVAQTTASNAARRAIGDAITAALVDTVVEHFSAPIPGTLLKAV